MKKNYKSDFLLMLHLYNAAGVEIGWPGFDWEADFHTFSTATTLHAASIGGTLTNCRREKGCICIVFKNHRLLAGKLQVSFTGYPASSEFADGIGRVTCRAHLDHELVTGTDDGVLVLHSGIVLPIAATDYSGSINELRAEIDALKQADREFNDKLADIETNGAGGCDCDCPDEATAEDIVGVINTEASAADIEAVINTGPGNND